MKFINFILLAVLITGCDSGVLWEEPPYLVQWIDTSENRSLNLSVGDGASIGRVEKEVIAIGSNKKYIVIKRRSVIDKKIYYYYLEKEKDKIIYNDTDITKGPFSKEEFQREKKYLKLPEFTKTF